jgi:hypothetical protein
MTDRYQKPKTFSANMPSPPSYAPSTATSVYDAQEQYHNIKADRPTPARTTATLALPMYENTHNPEMTRCQVHNTLFSRVSVMQSLSLYTHPAI